jgi:hypothetical protein
VSIDLSGRQIALISIAHDQVGFGRGLQINSFFHADVFFPDGSLPSRGLAKCKHLELSELEKSFDDRLRRGPPEYARVPHEQSTGVARLDGRERPCVWGYSYMWLSCVVLFRFPERLIIRRITNE